jgi:hypothetical protein
MADPAEQQAAPQQDLGPCGWCENKATTRLYVVGKKGAKNRKTAPVCDDHERQFLDQGATSERSELEASGPKNVRRYVIR